ncbi:OLC1v1014082C1 [Oldenlandia corymbosa var. corymbosa]|uniref:OLC1v1014082C1 n=1 Tax=Oldenlandia corymbosa var. corymbosa TaxID=529605 RepID=A0AAV1E089_OLDCO|nr:OLC1v1014082C1 [Oldenlandia corymbosa var. corymbosa]
MAEQSEKRFEAALQKMFPGPPKSSTPIRHDSSSNAVGFEMSRVKKRPHFSSALAIVGQKSRGNPIEELQNSTGSSGAVCKPWDRDDLFRRLATFKSMTWFAKPQAVTAVNCARRGWINVDVDTLSCESCGARLLFSTPSSWSQQQVEKAALVFSLKLDTGHKLLCPWVDNICDEKLASFPPKPTSVLVEDYRKRCSVLLHLTALPRISASAIDNMASPELWQFLGGDTGVGKNKSADDSYYQAQKLISLCGWEPHSLPYIVDCDIGKKDSSKIDNLAHQSHLASDGLNLSVVSCPSSQNIEDHQDSPASGGALFEPNSVALKCRLCGASVGLWAFSSVQRPLEFLRLVGYTEVDGSGAASTSFSQQTSNLSLTIAGGLPPAKQNYKATISLPVVGRILRAQISSNFQAMEKVVGEDQGARIIGEVEANRVHRPEDAQVVDGVLTSDRELVGNVESSHRDNALVLYHNRSQVGESSGTDAEDNAMTGNVGAGKNDTGMVPEAAICKGSDSQGDLQSGSSAADGNFSRINTLAKIPEQASAPKSTEFNPIQQHRLFCPWIASSGNSSPGWKQTLGALLQQKEFSDINLSPEKAPSTFMEVDDPIASIRKLFSSPPAKRMKQANNA